MDLRLRLVRLKNASGEGARKRAAESFSFSLFLSLTHTHALSLSPPGIQSAGQEWGSSCAGALGAGMMLALGETVAWQWEGAGWEGTR